MGDGGEGDARATSGDSNEVQSFSKSSKELPKSQNKAISQQNRAAKTYKTVDEGASERGKNAAETRKMNENARLQSAHDEGAAKGRIQGAAATAVAGAGVLAAHAALSSDTKTATAKPAPQPTMNSNPVRQAGDSTPKYHPDNKPVAKK